MKQFNLINENKQKVSVIMAEDAFDFNKTITLAGGPGPIRTNCLLKLSTYFFRNAFLKEKSAKKTDASSYTIQVFVKGLYAKDDDYNDIRVYFTYRLLKDDVVVSTHEPTIIKIPNLTEVSEISNCTPQISDDYEKGLKIAEFENKFTAATRKRWEKRLADVCSTAPIEEDDVKFIDIRNLSPSPENVKKNILIAVYNAAREHYRDIWEDKDNFEKNKTAFNTEFAGIAKIDDENKLSTLEYALIPSKFELTHANHDESFEALLDDLLKSCAGTRYSGATYALLQKHLNLLNQRVNYFRPIEPIYGPVNAIPLGNIVLDVVTAPTNLIGITSKRKDFEFQPHILGKGAPIAAPVASNNPFDLSFDQLYSSEPTSTTTEDKANPNATTRPRRLTRPTVTLFSDTNQRASQQITRSAQQGGQFPRTQYIDIDEPKKQNRNLSFGEKHPILKATLIGGAIGLAAAIALAIVIGIVMFPPAAVALASLAAIAMTASGHIGLGAAIIGGVVVLGTLIGGGIGASVGASAESKKQQRIATQIKEQNPEQPRKSPHKPPRSITRFAPEKKKEPLAPPPTQPLVPRPRVLPVAEVTSPSTSPKKREPSPPKLQVATKTNSTPTPSASSSATAKPKSYVVPKIPTSTKFFSSAAPLTAEDFKKDLLIIYAGTTYTQTYEDVVGGQPGCKVIIDTYTLPRMFSLIFSKNMMNQNSIVQLALIEVITSKKYENFNYDLLNYDDEYKNLAEIVNIIQKQLEENKSIAHKL